MSLRHILIALLCQLIISEQKSVQKIAVDSKQIEELQDLLKQLEVQINKEHEIHKHSNKHNGNIEGSVLNLLFQRDNNKERGRMGDEGFFKREDRNCKTGRCGCSGPRCGREIDSSSVEVTKLLDSLEKTIDKDIGHSDVRCRRGKCGDNIEELDNRNDDINLRSGQDMKQILERYGKIYKLNNQLDAIVLDISNVDDTLKELNKHCTAYANCKLIDYKSNGRTTTGVSEEKDSINGIILDMTHLSNSNNLAKDLNNALISSGKLNNPLAKHLSPDNLGKYYQNYKQSLKKDAVRFFKDKVGRRESVKYSNKNQKLVMQNLKNLLLQQNNGLKDKKIIKQIEEILFDQHNIYVPKGLHNKINYRPKRGDLRAQKRLLPLTLKQRNKLQKRHLHLWRRNSGSDYGLPFDLKIQGLGQVVS